TLSSFAPIILYLRFFFFQAEDGIRDFHVTGVQTCALPISPSSPPSSPPPSPSPPLSPFPVSGGVGSPPEWLLLSPPQAVRNKDRSEERRVGKECRTRRWRNRETTRATSHARCATDEARVQA